MADQVGLIPSFKTAVHNHSSAAQGGMITVLERGVGVTTSNVNAAPKSTNSGVFVLVKEIIVGEATNGTMTVYFDISRTGGVGNVNGRLYVNGAAVGVDHVDAGPGPVTYNDVLALNLVVGDKIQIYAHGTGANTVTIENFILQYAYVIHSIAGVEFSVHPATPYNTPIASANTM